LILELNTVADPQWVYDRNSARIFPEVPHALTFQTLPISLCFVAIRLVLIVDSSVCSNGAFKFNRQPHSAPRPAESSTASRTNGSPEAIQRVSGDSGGESISWTLPNHPSMSLSTARASAPTAVVSLLTRNPPQSITYFPKLPAPDRLLGPTNTPANVPYQSTQPNTATNNSRIAHAKPIAPPRPPRQRLRTNPPIASAPAANTFLLRRSSAPAHLSIGH